MTEDDKQSLLNFLREASRQMDLQDDRPEWQALYDQMKRDIDTRPPADPMNTMFLGMLAEVTDTIAKRTETLNKPKKAIRYLESNDAADMTQESVRVAMES